MEKLYNNIILPDDFSAKPSFPQDVPYLKNPPEVIDITVGRQLFVDDFLIEETDLLPEYHKAKKFEGNPVLKAETEWECAQAPVACPKSGGVFYDEDEKIFKMWYEAGWLHQMCYATSKDGVHWERPDLGIEPGTNKILTFDGFENEKLADGIDYLRPDSTTVFIDYNCDKSQRYKLFLRNPGGKYPAIVATSADGINFENFRFTEEMYDRSTMFYNPFRKKWVYSIRANWSDEVNNRLNPDLYTPGMRVRNYRECDDFLEGAKWTPREEHPWLGVDILDRPNPYIRFAPQLYNVDCVGYESIMLGMFQIMYGPENDVCESRGVPKITELIPMYSRDGYNFSRPCRDTFINASIHQGSWDRGYVQSVGGVTIINGDELWIYYIGFSGDESRAGQGWTTNGIYSGGATGIAKLRRDGFVSMNGSGTLTTRKLTFSGKTDMFVNAVGSVYAEIYGEAGQLLGKSSTFSGDSTKAKLNFADLDVATLNDKIIRIKFFVDGKLYSFGFADESGDFGGAHAAGVVK